MHKVVEVFNKWCNHPVMESDSLKDKLDFDSLDIFEILITLEEELGIEIPEAELRDWVTVGDVVKSIDRLQNG